MTAQPPVGVPLNVATAALLQPGDRVQWAINGKPYGTYIAHLIGNGGIRWSRDDTDKDHYSPFHLMMFNHRPTPGPKGQTGPVDNIDEQLTAMMTKAMIGGAAEAARLDDLVFATASADALREECNHAMINVVRSSDGTAPYQMCARCGLREYPTTPEHWAVATLKYIFGNVTRDQWEMIVQQECTPPLPLPHHARAMGMRK